MGRRHGHTPRYSLDRIQQLAATGRIRITNSAEQGAEMLYLPEGDIIECICQLSDDDYEQTLESTQFPGTFQDVYKPRYLGRAIYLKLRLIGDHHVLLISFKQDTSR
jgi:hypothetical protein